MRSLIERNHELAAERGETARPVFLKIAPDLTEGQLDDIAALCVEEGVSGIIATNTTISRDGLRTPGSAVEAIGNGGLSGAPLTERSRDVVAGLYRRTNGALPIIGVGARGSITDT